MEKGGPSVLVPFVGVTDNHQGTICTLIATVATRSISPTTPPGISLSSHPVRDKLVFTAGVPATAPSSRAAANAKPRNIARLRAKEPHGQNTKKNVAVLCVRGTRTTETEASLRRKFTCWGSYTRTNIGSGSEIFEHDLPISQVVLCRQCGHNPLNKFFPFPSKSSLLCEFRTRRLLEEIHRHEGIARILVEQSPADMEDMEEVMTIVTGNRELRLLEHATAMAARPGSLDSIDQTAVAVFRKVAFSSQAERAAAAERAAQGSLNTQFRELYNTVFGKVDSDQTGTYLLRCRKNVWDTTECRYVQW